MKSIEVIRLWQSMQKKEMATYNYMPFPLNMISMV